MSARRPLRSPIVGFVTLAVGLTAALAVSGCGGSPGVRHRAGAEPAVSPAPRHAPPGHVVAVGPGAEGIVADPSRRLVAVAVRDPPRLALLNARSGAVVRRVPLAGAARHLQLDGSGIVLVPEATRDRLLELPLSARAVPPRSVATGSLPHDAAAAGGRVFVTDEFGHAISVVAGDRAVGAIGGFVQPGGVTTVGDDVAVVDVGADTVSLIGARTTTVLGRVSFGSGLTHDATGPAGRVYVVDTRGDALFTLRTRPQLRVSSRLPLTGAPYGIAADPAHDRLWVTETATNRLVELDIAGPRPRPLAVFATVRQPNSVAVDPDTQTVYVAGAANGVVQVLGPAALRSASLGAAAASAAG